MSDHVHLLKLCVGAESVEDLTQWQEANAFRWPKGCAMHVTRMWPKRETEILSGGSLYWVIKGVVLARQRIIGLEKVDEGDGIERCGLLLDRQVVRTSPAPRRPFQGWRYLNANDAPPDLSLGGKNEETLPPGMAEALAEFGVR